MKTEDLITDIDKKIAHFLNRSTESSLAEDFEAIKSYVRADKVLTEARLLLLQQKGQITIEGMGFAESLAKRSMSDHEKELKLDRAPILVYERNELFGARCLYRTAKGCEFYEKAMPCAPTPEFCPRMKP